MIKKHSLSVILPAYNEGQVIGNTILGVWRVLQQWQLDAEIIVVNE